MKKILITLFILVILEGVIIALAAIYKFKIPIFPMALIPLVFLWFAFRKNSEKE